ncbi:phage/plasmid replication protein, II/X family [Chitinimonas lacunae]|uniref:Phage/plasmid replication protein, II/X family n=1 Tax=Chitinimonas lacunae TaxID=1963018 RepID=A0ABV8MN41_9NEIS
MIDWLTLKIDVHRVPREVIEKCHERAGTIMHLMPDGEIKWRRVARESIRSDSHQMVIECTTHFVMHGSPARVGGDNNVFGSGDIVDCAQRMIRFAAKTLGVILPMDLSQWRVSRVDVTHNYALASAQEVAQALSVLRQSEGGRFQVRTNAETIYWGSGSSIRRMKAYAKGPHLLRQFKRNEAHANFDEIEMSQRLLRLELSLMGQFWRERSQKPWFEYTESDLDALHNEYFGQVIGSVEIAEMQDLRQAFRDAAVRLRESSPPATAKTFSEASADRAYMIWALIKAVGLRQAEDTTPRSTWFRSKKIMMEAGLSWSDLHAGQVLPFRRKAIVLGAPVRSWDELRSVA